MFEYFCCNSARARLAHARAGAFDICDRRVKRALHIADVLTTINCGKRRGKLFAFLVGDVAQRAAGAEVTERTRVGAEGASLARGYEAEPDADLLTEHRARAFGLHACRFGEQIGHHGEVGGRRRQVDKARGERVGEPIGLLVIVQDQGFFARRAGQSPMAYRSALLNGKAVRP